MDEKEKKPHGMSPVVIVVASGNDIETVNISTRDELSEFIKENIDEDGFDDNGIGRNKDGWQFVIIRGRVITPKVRTTTKLSYR